MRDIRARISQRHGIELTAQQIQELAARRLEAVLDPRTMSPSLVEQLRKGAAAPVEVPLPAVEGGYTFEATTLYETHRGVLRFFRRLLNPILKLFFNPNPLVHALHTQAEINRDMAARETERERRQAEWNALHYEILNRLVTEIARASIETQALATRLESLTGRVDFADRRVRALESAPAPRHSQQPHVRAAEAVAQAAPSPAPSSATPAVVGAPAEAPATGEGTGRRKRRRRRGRRSGGGVSAEGASAEATAVGVDTEFEGPDGEEGDDDEAVETPTVPAFAAADEPAPEVRLEAVVPFELPVGAPVEADAPQVPVEQVEAAAPAERHEPVQPAAPAERHEPVQPAPPPDEPTPAAPVDRPDPGPPDR